VRTALEIDGAEARFLLLELDEDEQAAARDLFYAEEDGAFAKRFPAADAERVYPRFAACARELIDQTARRAPARWQDALETVVERAGEVDWWLTGSGALAVRGIAVAPRDLDLVTSAEGAEELARLFADLVVEPLSVGDGWVATHFGRAFAGARVEWVGNVSPAFEATDFGAAAAARLETVAWHGHALRLPPIELQLESARARGLADRVAAIALAEERVLALEAARERDHEADHGLDVVEHHHLDR
jgi:hypothetical protein